MPEISRFYGIVIGMFYEEHGVAHFHAVYGKHEISVEVESGYIRGDKAELIENWKLARQGLPLTRIAPLE